MREKRQHPRVQVALNVVIELPDGNTLEATAADISLGGMYIETTDSAPFGANVTVVCALPRLENARLPGVIRWNKPGGFGVQFGLLGARETHAIGLLVKSTNQATA